MMHANSALTSRLPFFAIAPAVFTKNNVYFGVPNLEQHLLKISLCSPVKQMQTNVPMCRYDTFNLKVGNFRRLAVDLHGLSSVKSYFFISLIISKNCPIFSNKSLIRQQRTYTPPLPRDSSRAPGKYRGSRRTRSRKHHYWWYYPCFLRHLWFLQW